MPYLLPKLQQSQGNLSSCPVESSDSGNTKTKCIGDGRSAVHITGVSNPLAYTVDGLTGRRIRKDCLQVQLLHPHLQKESDMGSLEELTDRVQKLNALLQKPEPGLMTWYMFVGEHWKRIAELWKEEEEHDRKSTRG